ncbi:MAG: hypothetical protein IK092_07730, partial [Muribaculaceae bacterium]|nr:hypothetical protein [Muribaculaceae bacterium]
MKLHSLIPIVLLITTLTTGISANAENPRLLSPQLRSTSNVFGDVNGDGETDVKDVTALISYVLGATPPQFVVENANING